MQAMANNDLIYESLKCQMHQKIGNYINLIDFSLEFNEQQSRLLCQHCNKGSSRSPMNLNDFADIEKTRQGKIIDELTKYLKSVSVFKQMIKDIQTKFQLLFENFKTNLNEFDQIYEQQRDQWLTPLVFDNMSCNQLDEKVKDYIQDPYGINRKRTIWNSCCQSFKSNNQIQLMKEITNKVFQLIEQFKHIKMKEVQYVENNSQIYEQINISRALLQQEQNILIGNDRGQVYKQQKNQLNLIFQDKNISDTIIKIIQCSIDYQNKNVNNNSLNNNNDKNDFILCSKNTIAIFNLEGQLKCKTQENNIKDIIFDSKSKKIYSANSKQEIKIWKLEINNEQTQINQQQVILKSKGEICYLTLNHSFTKIASTNGGIVQCWNTINESYQKLWEGKTIGKYWRINFINDNQLLVQCIKSMSDNQMQGKNEVKLTCSFILYDDQVPNNVKQQFELPTNVFVPEQDLTIFINMIYSMEFKLAFCYFEGFIFIIQVNQQTLILKQTIQGNFNSMSIWQNQLLLSTQQQSQQQKQGRKLQILNYELK